MITALIIGSILVGIGSAMGVAWFFLKNDGIYQAFLKGRDNDLNSLRDSYLKLFERVAEMEQAMIRWQTQMDELEASALRRIGSFEARYGKASKEERRQEALQVINQAAVQQSQQLGGNNSVAVQ